jgi:hypothetical protein
MSSACSHFANARWYIAVVSATTSAPFMMSAIDAIKSYLYRTHTLVHRVLVQCTLPCYNY